ncbi:hypothetical protein [Rossellomorea aquimaris]|uniref:Uncharacterized protein n=1 Tax=Rossellomorea aquimaris TaxID=189382 RepID=A0A1J6VTV3_9BACI|nr:hypothetical protein [Rossellomorea aquimaris]OIU68701.1 hypothetical protein BHE18_17445 [Rossellomorea aquimaris]
MGIRQAKKNEGKINLMIRNGAADPSVDVSITPIYCVSCDRQLPHLYEHTGSRYGQVGTINCEYCETPIHCTDGDNIVYELRTSGFVMNYYHLYRLEKEIWITLKESYGYDISARHKGSTITLETVVDELSKEFKIPAATSRQYTSNDGKITMFPNVVVKWFSILEYFDLYK